MQNQQTTEKQRPPQLFEAGFTFSLAQLLALVVSFVALMIAGAIIGEQAGRSDVYKYVGYLAPQLCFAAASLVFFRRRKMTVREIYTPCKWYYFLIALLLAFGLFSLSELNGYFIEFLQLLGYKPVDTSLPEYTIPNVSGWNLLPAILVIALLPAIFEETLFRGIQVGSMQSGGWGIVATVFISGALFSVFHNNPEQTVYQFICGCVYALLAIRSGSILPTMLAHFANNAVILSLASAGLNDFPQEAKLPIYLVAGIVLLAVLAFLVFFAKRGNQKGGVKGGKQYFLTASIGIVVCAVQWIYAFVAGFLR